MASPQNGLPPTTTPVPASGDPLLDSLTGDYKAGGPLGTGAILSFSFPWSASGTATWASTPNYSPLDEPASGFALSPMQQAAFRSALASWSQVANLQFVEVADNPDAVGDIRIAWTGVPNPPSDAWTWQSSGFWANAGDIWLSDALMGGQPDADWQAGGFNYMALIHELGHSLWLKHPFEGGAVMPADTDTNQYTVMSYTEHPHYLFVRYHPAVLEPDGSVTVSWDVVPVYPSTPMLLDVAAIQRLYGANMGWHTGNDVYTFDPDTPFIMTLWDAGGVDTISASNFSTSCLIDLREGHYSSLHILPDPSITGLMDPPVVPSLPSDYDGTDNLAIAWGAVFENAIAGTGNDVLIGNAVANSLTGGAGNDTLDGGEGADTAVFAGSRAGAVIAWDAVTAQFTITTAPDGTDVVRNVEQFSFAGQIFSAAQLNDHVAPTVVASSPADGSTGLAPDSPIRFTFSEGIERGVGSIVLRTDAGALVESFDVASSARLSIAGNTLTIDPTTELDVFTAYRIEFSPGAVHDLAGNPFAASSTYGFTTGTVDGLYHFFIVAFDAAPGVVYMGQLAEAWNFGLSLQEIVDIFTTKAQFTDSYPLSLTHAQLASELVTHIIKSSASAEARAEAVADVTAALDAGWSRGEVIYTVFGNLAAKPLDDAKWGGTAQQFHHEIDVARYYTETLHQGTTDLPTLRAVIAGVTQSSDTSSPEKIQALIDAALLPHPASAALASMPDLTLVGSATGDFSMTGLDQPWVG